MAYYLIRLSKPAPETGYGRGHTLTVPTARMRLDLERGGLVLLPAEEPRAASWPRAIDYLVPLSSVECVTRMQEHGDAETTSSGSGKTAPPRGR